MRLENRVAWVTGAGRRLGRAIALELARRGCHLALHYGTSAAEAHEVAREAEALGRRALVVRADLGRVDEIGSMGRRIEAEFGGLDILINSAANFIRVPFESITEAEWDASLDVNLKGSAFCALEAARLMRLKGTEGENLLESAAGPPAPAVIRLFDDDGPTTADLPAAASAGLGRTGETSGRVGAMRHRLWGKIINFADWSGLRPHRHYLPYMVSKGGVVTLTQALALELAPEITVNAIAPGTVLPPESTGAVEIEKIERNIPLGRIGEPADIVATALYLLEGTDYVSGQVICVDGGRYVSQPGRG